MSSHFDLVVSRLKNMLTRISAEDADFEDLCARHAELTAGIRKLNPREDPDQAQRDEALRKRRADLEQEMFAIMQANVRI
ncbi:hypothetical protein [Pelagibius sp.]|uniref:hypothetical protein n=1 Tax=Pelagibius sp. TaxID=1931238 RepID=UPI002623E8CE|nr:hypothetical protein [Pelagibius sp.]